MRIGGQTKALIATKMCDFIVLSNDYRKKELHAQREKGMDRKRMKKTLAEK